MKASQSGIGELLGTPCTVRRRLCAFLELPDIVNVCNASGIKIADTFSHSNGDMCTSLALTMQRHKYKDAAFMDKLRNFRTLEFLELHVPKQHPEKSQEPYKDLIRNDNTFSSLHNNTEGKLESPSPSFHTPINNLATQIRRCNINDVIDSPLIASPKLNGFTAPEFCELGRSSGFPIDEVDISPCAHCGGIDDVNNDDIRLNGLYFPQQRQDTLGGRNAPSLSERTEFPTTCPRVPSWNTLQLRLPVESLEWCLIFVDLNPQVKDIAFISTSSSLHPRTQTDDVRRVVGLLPKAM
eukprot:Selendium_serpulae@DN6371_c1_g1_i5.p1